MFYIMLMGMVIVNILDQDFRMGNKFVRMVYEFNGGDMFGVYFWLSVFVLYQSIFFFVIMFLIQVMLFGKLVDCILNILGNCIDIWRGLYSFYYL